MEKEADGEEEASLLSLKRESFALSQPYQVLKIIKCLFFSFTGRFSVCSSLRNVKI
jgi:hypothetical protein